MITFSNTYRSKQDEILDNFDLQGTEMEKMLHDLDTVNSWLGGDSVTISGVQQLLKSSSKSKVIRIIDMGCGDGAMLRKLAKFGASRGYQFELIGLDANPFILEVARARSQGVSNLRFMEHNIFSEIPKELNCDIALCTLFLHHFDNERIKTILDKLTMNAKVGVVVNDLHRSRSAFWLFKGFSSIFIKTKIARHDGLVSVARGFKKGELEALARNFNQSNHFITWKWAFRWQWIIKTNS